MTGGLFAPSSGRFPFVQGSRAAHLETGDFNNILVISPGLNYNKSNYV